MELGLLQLSLHKNTCNIAIFTRNVTTKLYSACLMLLYTSVCYSVDVKPMIDKSIFVDQQIKHTGC